MQQNKIASEAAVCSLQASRKSWYELARPEKGCLTRTVKGCSYSSKNGWRGVEGTASNSGTTLAGCDAAKIIPGVSQA